MTKTATKKVKELNITNYTDKIEQFQSKIFLLENLLQEKETQITILKKATIQPITNTNKKGNHFNIQHYLHNKNGIKEIREFERYCKFRK